MDRCFVVDPEKRFIFGLGDESDKIVVIEANFALLVQGDSNLAITEYQAWSQNNSIL
ncbi:MAG: hypothetical protein R3B54_03710 [Bdellovibrionota bacterium]